MCYEKGENLSLRETVAAAAERAGVPGGAEYGMDNDGVDELIEKFNNVRSESGERVKGVPFYSIKREPTASRALRTPTDGSRFWSTSRRRRTTRIRRHAAHGERCAEHRDDTAAG
mmetsp:Transcript_37111/g.119287  ORF Transcript_37111/g.119287 Transcript_37111/m.119287 type:complete len:115 (+) Transcript_37111:425-769(+)